MAPPLPDYAQAIASTRKYIADVDGRQTGDPERAARAILDHVAQNRPELRMVLGKIAMTRMEAKLKTMRSELDSGLERALDADFPD